MTQVVLVDDDRTSSELIKMLLEMDGLSVTTCPDLACARQAAADTDAFVIDCNLAGGASGLDLIPEIRNGSLAAAANTVIIVSSGDDRRQDEAIRRGANTFLMKPYPPSTLSALITKLVT